jgi:acetyltransferase
MAPITEADAARMIDSLRGVRLLRGFRGAPSTDEKALAALIARLSRLAAAYEREISEIDLNPVVYSGGRWLAADALIKLKSIA